MRYMLDTCAFIDAVTDPDMLGPDVCALMEDYENVFYISQETVKEVILKYKNKRIWTNIWPTAEHIVDAIYNQYQFIIDPINQEHLRQYARLTPNEAQSHKDPSDHIIISHAIANRIPLISRDGKFDYYQSQGLQLISYGRKK